MKAVDVVDDECGCGWEMEVKRKVGISSLSKKVLIRQARVKAR